MNIQELSVEKRIIKGSRPLSRDLACHMQSRYIYGKIAVVSDRPAVILSSVRRQWLGLIRSAQRERASTLKHLRQQELEQTIWWMQNASFTARDPAHDPIAHVSFATIEQYRLFPPTCNTLYIIGSIEKIDQYLLTSWMPKGGLVVIYD
jgi:hypothetical protein